MDMNLAAQVLERLLGKEDLERFLCNFEDNTFYKCQLQATASQILTVLELQEIINTRRLSFPRCRLVRLGKPLPPASYNEYGPLVMGERIIKLIPDCVMRELRHGATLALDFAEDISLNIRSIAESLSIYFQERTGATVFFSVGNEKGFTTHWDNSDTLIFQLSGMKKWLLFDNDFSFPVEENKSTMTIPQGDPTDVFTLHENEFLYLPRGQWHAPEPCDSHSLHISFAFRRRNGIDFIKALLPQLAEHLAFRSDINKFSSIEECDNYISELKSAFQSVMTAGSLSDFLNSCQKRKFINDTISLDALIQYENHEE